MGGSEGPAVQWGGLTLLPYIRVDVQLGHGGLFHG